ncbi:MAG: hypothetical protein JW840_08280 [Candidatus Thermoplasmatota archaeon]|nr:hypothetical protein [Candidatus Thermoplasmatota archaeon]
MKTKERTLIVFLLMSCLVFTSVTPLISAQEGYGNQYGSGQGNSSSDPQQSPPEVPGSMGGFGGQQSGGNHDNGSGPGGDNENSSGGHQYRHRYQRRYTIMDGTENYTRIRSQCRHNRTDEAFEIFFSIDAAPTLELSYLPSLNASMGERHFNLVIDQLIEYLDSNENGKYDHNDDIVSSLVFSNVTFSNITYTNSTTPDGKTITIIETHTTDNLFSILIYLVSEQTSIFNNIITQKEVKIDFTIIGYPYVNQSSQLALVTQVDTPFDVLPEQNTYDEQQGIAAQESGLNISSPTRSGFFTWANEAVVDNKTYPVNVTVLSTSEQTFSGNVQEAYTQSQVIFSYPRGESIVHDPKIGVIELLGGVLPAVLQVEYLSIIYLLACLVAGIVFYGVVFIRKKR